MLSSLVGSEMFIRYSSKLAEKLVEEASKKTIVIDNSSYFRLKKDVPLVVAEVNPESLKNHKNIISNPNCSTMQMVLALNPLHKKYKIKRVIVSSDQAVSGAGKAAMDELMEQTKNAILPLNPQENVCYPFEVNVNTQLLEKDEYKPPSFNKSLGK